jgi:hypothetical protein
MNPKLYVAALALIAAGSAATYATRANALTLQQAQQELAGMYCSGSTCSQTTTANGTRTEVVPGAPIIEGGYSEAKPAKQRQGEEAYFDCGFPMTYGTIESIGGVLTCIPGSAIGEASTSPSIVGYQPDGSRSVNTVTTTVTTKELIYNGPNTSRDMAWDVNTTVSTSTVDAP